MIFTTVHFHSFVLGVGSVLNVLLPQHDRMAEKATTDHPYRTLYLLHGLSDDHTAWQRYTSIERYAEGRNLAVVMPAVQRSFYTDMAHGGKFWTYISEEVPLVARELFSLSGKREDTFAAGLSMGGYGAFKLALRCPERFAAAASLSGVLNLNEAAAGRDPAWHEEMSNIFGDPTRLKGSTEDLLALAEKVSRTACKPRLYQCCGTEDFLYENNQSFRKHIQQLGFAHTYEESPGDHEWGYWDQQIQKVVDWLDVK